MSYTLVNAAALGFELARLPAGPTIAQVLVTALTADAATLVALAAEPADHRSSAQKQQPGDQLRFITTQAASVPTSQQMCALLSSTRLDGPQALERLIRHEILGPGCQLVSEVGHRVGQLAADRVTTAALDGWAVTSGIDVHPRAGTPGWVPRTAAHHRDGTGLGPQTAAISDLLDSLATPRLRAAWQAARPAQSSAWAAAMHQACWAAHLSNRIHIAAQVQLLGALAFRATGFGPADVASGSWNALSGVLQAVVVADLLDEESTAVLLAPARGRSARAADDPSGSSTKAADQ